MMTVHKIIYVLTCCYFETLTKQNEHLMGAKVLIMTCLLLTSEEFRHLKLSKTLFMMFYHIHSIVPAWHRSLPLQPIEWPHHWSTVTVTRNSIPVQTMVALFLT